MREEVLGLDTLRVTLTINGDCPKAKYLVVVTFGARPVGRADDRCTSQKNVTKDPLSPGETASFSLEAESVSLRAEEEYCYFVSFHETSSEPVIPATSGKCSGNTSLSVGGAAGIAVALTLVIAAPVCVVLGCCGMWCLMKRRGDNKRNTCSSGDKQESADDGYEVPGVGDCAETIFSLSDNQAYGQAVAHNRPRGNT